MDEVITFLQGSGAHRLPHAHGRTLLAHLIGTRDILQRWGLGEWVQRAGLLHSVYGTGSYHRQLLQLSQRREVVTLAGERAERLAYLFGAIAPNALFTAAGAQEPMALPVERGPAHQEIVMAPEIDELVVMHMANTAEQARAKDESPGLWLARVGKLGAALSKRPIEVPRSLAGQLPQVSAENEEIIRNAYRSAIAELGGQAAGAERRLAQVIGECPVVPEPYLWLAYISLCRREWATAIWWTVRGRDRLVELGTSWDKRLGFEEWALVADRLQACSVERLTPAENVVFGPVQLLKALTAAEDDCRKGSDDARDRKIGTERSRSYLETFTHQGGDGLRRHYPGLDSQPFYDPAGFPLVKYLEANFGAIRKEIRALDPSRFQPEAESIDRTGDWEVIFFYDRGRRVNENCEACPVLTQGIDNHATMRTIAGLIYVSRLRSNTHIAPHRGPTNFRLRCHLGIEVPDGDCAICVGGVTHSWEEGRCLVLDDHLQHEAWNHTDRDRVVLVVDVWHPGLTAAEIELLKGLHRYAYSYARRQHQWWLRHYPESGSPING